MRRVAITFLVLAGLSVQVFSQNTPADRAGGGVAAEDVLAIVGVEQDGYVSQLVRLPYLKYPRHPEFEATR